MLDPDDEKVIAEAKSTGAVLITWDRVTRLAAGGKTPYEILEQAEHEAQIQGKIQAEVELIRLRKLSPLELTRLGTAADKTSALFRVHIHLTKAEAIQVRQLRVELDYSWRAIARFYSVLWGGLWGSNQITGMVICEKAANLLGEDFMQEPWN
ncbi:MAG: hypothetical protein Q8O55_08910 [Dehalococcoidales bacterium]|nr:hypothetical protein [Dehalococcoidales bacterium]